MPEKMTTTSREPERDHTSSAIDPVCGMTVDPLSASAKFDWHDASYFFCCSACQVAFSKNPDSYLTEAQPVEQSVHDSQAGNYVCPMHPEVQKTAPGDCPQCGMALLPSFDAGQASFDHLNLVRRRLILSGLFTLPLFGLKMSNMSHTLMSSNLSFWLEFLLASPVVLWLALPFFKKGGDSLKNGNLNMFTLLSLGIGIPYLFSAISPLLHALLPGDGTAYFESSAVIATLAWLGQYLEAKAQIQSTGSITKLLSLRPPRANLLNDDGSTRTIDVSEIKPQARLLVRPGERIPVDGQIIGGEGTVDESMLTGESMPKLKSNGDKVAAGTLNLDGSLEIKTERTGKDTTLAQIVDLVSEAQRSRVPVQKMADRVSAIFVPCVIAIASLTFIGWSLAGLSLYSALSISLSVLLVACPCALGLATPMSIIVAAGKGASAGILFKSAATLETLARIDILIVDKTGTLTKGEPTVTRIESLGARSAAEILALAASLERRSEHPFAKGIVAEAKAQAIAIAESSLFKSTSGLGVRGTVDGAAIAVGSSKFLQLEEQIAALEPVAPGVSRVFLAVGDECQGYIELKDGLRAQAKNSISAFRNSGIRIVLASGDNALTTQSIATECGITEFYGALMPNAKEELIQKFQQQGQIVAMLGDGINDAPALARANIGLALSSGTEIAIDSADIVLVKGDLAAALSAFKLSKGMVRNIGENLFLAFAYNLAAIPIAAGVFLPLFGWTIDPMLAATAMAMSSVLVIGNALRLKQLPLN